MLVLVFIALATCVGTCVFFGILYKSVQSQYIDVTADKKYWGRYEPGQEYRLKVDVFLAGSGLMVPGEWIAPKPDSEKPPLADGLVTPGELIAPKSDDKNPPPATIAEYCADPTKWPGYSVIPAGTRIRISRIRMWRTVTYHRIEIFADIIDGAIQQKDVQITLLSRPWQSPQGRTLWEPNPLVLERVTP